MYQFIDSVDPREHDAFVKAHPLCDLLQSSAWTKVKSNWDHQIVGLRKRSRLATSALILIRRLPLGLCMMYIPRGPIMDLTDEEMTRSFFQALKAWAKNSAASSSRWIPQYCCAAILMARRSLRKTRQHCGASKT